MPVVDAAVRRTRTTITAVDRAVDVLLILAQMGGEPLPFGDVARLAGLPAATTHRVLQTLINRGLVEHNPTLGYTLGVTALQLASAAEVHFRFDSMRQGRPIYMPHLKKARDATGETVTLSICREFNRVHIARISGTKPVRQASEIGEKRPLYLGAASKVLLSALPDEEIEDYLDSSLFGSLDTDASRTTIWDQIERTRMQGYCETLNERNNGGASVAAPVLDFTGDVIGAIHLSIPVYRFHGELRDACRDAVIEASKALSRDLGFLEFDAGKGE